MANPGFMQWTLDCRDLCTPGMQFVFMYKNYYRKYTFCTGRILLQINFYRFFIVEAEERQAFCKWTRQIYQWGEEGSLVGVTVEIAVRYIAHIKKPGLGPGFSVNVIPENY
jgi:hypothetical protein